METNIGILEMVFTCILLSGQYKILLESIIGIQETVFFSQASIRAPVGATFVPRTAHLKMIKPRIKTRAGEVIEPMSRY